MGSQREKLQKEAAEKYGIKTKEPVFELVIGGKETLQTKQER